jgi:hypothetical protein
VGNILNLCGVSLPCGFTREGLPIGLMVYGKPFQEDMALRVARGFEQATDWHQRHPDLAWAAGGARRTEIRDQASPRRREEAMRETGQELGREAGTARPQSGAGA